MKTKLILFITVFLLSASLKSQNVKIENDYKNSLSVDVGSFAMLNYHRRIFRKNWYALNGQVGIGSYYESKSELVFIGAININAYLNNIFTIKKHSEIMPAEIDEKFVRAFNQNKKGSTPRENKAARSTLQSPEAQMRPPCPEYYSLCHGRIVA